MSNFVQPSYIETQQRADSPDAKYFNNHSEPTLNKVYSEGQYQFGNVLPPRTGYLRVNYYRRAGDNRRFPTSCAAGIALLGVALFPLGLILLGAKGVQSTGILTSTYLFTSGFTEIVLGMWAIVDNNLWGSTFMICYGSFFMALGGINTNILGVQDQYDSEQDFNNAYGLLLLGWTIFTFVMWTATLKSTISIFALMTMLTIFFSVYSAYIFLDVKACKIISGVLAILMGLGCFSGVYDGLNEAPNAYMESAEKYMIMPGNRAVPKDDKYIEVI
ncbi:hypothetical protein FOA43_003482 [Brettanomyces nanus]|uniref:GPR1/FUN34/yaaH family protein n=1 Tax=Eeniella nana TaxID=13502 RepID=A0A875S463_EENNA|nr:uncharacterized protein FOA43_003482 [Brettanomyces nanus]QPG76096.1 hypothetical protein FOA43_003482 [Brettanomyces nanus]